MMKVLLTAINAKYIHSNLAVYSLKAYAEKNLSENARANTEIWLAEYTINQQTDDILQDIYKKKPDMLCLSCYIWNLNYVEEIVREIHKLLPEMLIWIGGLSFICQPIFTLYKYRRNRLHTQAEKELPLSWKKFLWSAHKYTPVCSSLPELPYR